MAYNEKVKMKPKKKYIIILKMTIIEKKNIYAHSECHKTIQIIIIKKNTLFVKPKVFSFWMCNNKNNVLKYKKNWRKKTNTW